MEVLALIASDTRYPEPPSGCGCDTGQPDRRRGCHGNFYFLPQRLAPLGPAGACCVPLKTLWPEKFSRPQLH